MMRKLFISWVLLVCPLAQAAAEAPFSPVRNIVDYVATKVELGWGGRPTDAAQTVAHHAGWTRIDRVRDQQKSTSYFGPADFTSVSVARGASGERNYLNIQRGPQEHELSKRLGWDYANSSTGERQLLVGESCEVWTAARNHDTRTGEVRITKSSCVTDDGIELWTRSISSFSSETISAVQATKIERRPVQPSEVQPSADLLDLKSWVDSAEELGPTVPLPEAPGDVEVIMQAQGAATDRWSFNRTTLRRHPWTYTEDVNRSGSRTLSIRNEASRLAILFESGAAGEFSRLNITKGWSLARGQEMTLGRRETVLGEECTWFNMMPGAADAGLEQCKTPDGLVLKEVRSGRGMGVQIMEAVRLQRRIVGLAEVLPPAAILTRKDWGLPN